MFYATTTVLISNSHSSDKKLWGSNIASNSPEVSFTDVMDRKSQTGLAMLTDNIVSPLPK
jgi:hypothetical protein